MIITNLLGNSDDKLIFRPGGHGALIENLNQLDADIIFLLKTSIILLSIKGNDSM
jgi:hypothetical protein